MLWISMLALRNGVWTNEAVQSRTDLLELGPDEVESPSKLPPMAVEQVIRPGAREQPPQPAPVPPPAR